MATCEVCGNDYDLSFEIHTVDGDRHVFDSLECAAHRLAPVCEHCGCRVLGHGVQADGHFLCCAHCARESDVDSGAQIRDSAGDPTAALAALAK